MKHDGMLPRSPLSALLAIYLGFALQLFSSVAYADNIFVVGYQTGRIDEFSTSGADSLFGTASAPGAYGLACDASGNLYVGSIGSGRITRFDANGNQSTFTSVLKDSSDLAVDLAGNLYAINGGNVNVGVYEFSPSGEPIHSYSVGNVNQNPQGLAVDGQGNIFVGVPSQGNFIIEKITPAGSTSTFATLVSSVASMAFGPDGKLYVVYSGQIWVYAPDGTRTQFPTQGMAFGGGIAFDGSGNLYAVKGVNSIEKFTPSGGFSTFASGIDAAQEDFINRIAIFVPQQASTITDTPAMPTWGYIILATTLIVFAGRTLAKSAPKS